MKEKKTVPETVSSEQVTDRRKLFRRLVALAGLGVTGFLLSQDRRGLLPTVSGETPMEHVGPLTIVSGAIGSFIGIDNNNNIYDNYCVITGGQNNTAGTQGGTLGSNAYATVGGGDTNTASAEYATVGGGYSNTASLAGATVGGGNTNTASNYDATVAGGVNNQATGNSSTVGGGLRNIASGSHATVGGGIGNTASADYATACGGYGNTASGENATIPGGYHNNAAAGNSFAAGSLANVQATHNGAILFSDDSDLLHSFNSAAAREFAVRCTGGARFVTAIDSSGNPTQTMALSSAGQLGVGTTTPASPLNVIGPAFEEIQFLKSGGTQPSRLHATGDGINRFAVNMGYDGTNFNLDNTADNGVSFLINSNTSATGIFAIQYIPPGSNPATSRLATNYLFMTANGNVGLSRVPTANNLEVEGNASKATAGSWLANSDMRIKTEISDIDDALGTIRKLHPVRFRYRDEYRRKHPSIKDHVYYNFIAQEYREVFPDSVQDDGTGLLQVDTYNATPYLVKAMQEQQREIEQLKTENKAIIEENKLMREEMKTLQYTVKRLAAS